MIRRGTILFLFLLLFGSCSSVKVNGEARFRLETVAKIKRNCKEFIGREVYLRATYLGWRCNKGCTHPRITRSDSCIADRTGCIYLLGTGKLDPITDKGKEFLFRGRVEISPFSHTCYIKVEKVDGVK